MGVSRFPAPSAYARPARASPLSQRSARSLPLHPAAGATSGGRANGAASQAVKLTSKPQGQSFADWLAAQQAADGAPPAEDAEAEAGGVELGVPDDEGAGGKTEGEEGGFIVEDADAEARALQVGGGEQQGQPAAGGGWVPGPGDRRGSAGVAGTGGQPCMEGVSGRTC
jgi:hypothetical protein